MKHPIQHYFTTAENKIQTLSGKYAFSAAAWNAYAELLMLREFSVDCEKDSDWKLYDKMYDNLADSDKFGLALYVEHETLRNKEVR